MGWELIAVASCAVMLAWLLVTEWVPLPPLNDLAASTTRERVWPAVVNYGVLGAIAAGMLVGTTWGAIAALSLAVLWLLGHVISWWLPYLGVSTHAQRAAYQREYARTLKVLPTEGHDVVIDVQHMVVGALTIPLVVAVAARAVQVLS